MTYYEITINKITTEKSKSVFKKDYEAEEMIYHQKVEAVDVGQVSEVINRTNKSMLLGEI